MDHKVIYIDGEFVPAPEAKVSVFDHGFLYGDGVFEGIRAYNGRVFKLAEHLERMYESAKSIALKIPLTPEEMARIVVETVRANGLRDAYIRVVVSRGPGDLGLDPRKCPRPTVVVIADLISIFSEELYREGVRVVTAAVRRTDIDSLSPRVKSLNYLNSIMAKMEATKAGCPEAVILNQQGYVVEGTADNIFIVKGAKLVTPPCWAGALGGITRSVVLEIAPSAGLEPAETLMTRHDLYNADECFLTGTAAEIVPVVEVDGRQIGSGRPGDHTKKLMAEFRRVAQSTGAAVYE